MRKIPDGWPGLWGLRDPTVCSDRVPATEPRTWGRLGQTTLYPGKAGGQLVPHPRALSLSPSEGPESPGCQARAGDSPG